MQRNRLMEIRGEIEDVSATIRTTAAKFTDNGNKWPTDELRAEFDNAVARRAVLEEELRMESPAPQPGGACVPGREPTSQRRGFGDDAEQRGTDIDLAVAGWLRNAYGVPVAPDEARAAERLGMSVIGQGFEIALRACRPTIGRNLRFDDRWGIESRALSTVAAASGGVTAPSGFVRSLESAMKAFGPMLTTSEIMLTEFGHEMPWPTLDDASTEGEQIGESQLSEDSDLTFGALIMRAYKFTSGVVKAPHELLRDNAVNLATEIGTALGMRLARAINTKATVGTGAGTLSGIVTGAALGQTTASATAITMDELVDLQNSVDPAYRFATGTGWMMSSNVAAYVQKLKDGNGNYIWNTPNVGILGSQPAVLLGAPVYINQAMDDAITTGKKTVLFGDLSKYKLRLVGATRLRTLTERYAEYDQTGFLAFAEADGALMRPSTSATLCPVKYLQQA